MDGSIPEYENVKNKKNIYMTPEAIRKKNLKNKLWRRYKSSGCKYDRSRYTKVKIELRSLRKLRIQFEKRHRSRNHGIPKENLVFCEIENENKK